MPKPVIFGLSGPSLGDEERRFFARSDPLGFILFARNCEQPDQVSALVEPPPPEATARPSPPTWPK